MHDDELINACALGSEGAHEDSSSRKGDSDKTPRHGTVDIDMDNIEQLFFTTTSASMPHVAQREGEGDDGLVNNVDNFLESYLLLGGGGGLFGDGSGVENGMDVGFEDFLPLEDPDALLPLPASSASSVPVVSSTFEAALVACEQTDTAVSPAPSSEAHVPDIDGGTGIIHEAIAMASPSSIDRAPVVAAVGIEPPPPTEAAVVTSAPAAAPCDESNKNQEDSVTVRKEKIRRQKVVRYLEKKKRRVWSRTAPYKSRQRVANSRPRFKGRFLPLESEFVPIAELQRRKRAEFKQVQEALQAQQS